MIIIRFRCRCHSSCRRSRFSQLGTSKVLHFQLRPDPLAH